MFDRERGEHRVGYEVAGDLVSRDKFAKYLAVARTRLGRPHNVRVKPATNAGPRLVRRERIVTGAWVRCDPQERRETLPRDSHACRTVEALREPGVRALVERACGVDREDQQICVDQHDG